MRPTTSVENGPIPIKARSLIPSPEKAKLYIFDGLAVMTDTSCNIAMILSSHASKSKGFPIYLLGTVDSI